MEEESRAEKKALAGSEPSILNYSERIGFGEFGLGDRGWARGAAWRKSRGSRTLPAGPTDPTSREAGHQEQSCTAGEGGTLH